MNYLVIVLFSFSISLAALIGAVRFGKINAVYRPFLYLLWIGLLNEVVSLLLSKWIHNTAYNNNIYVLAEGLLLTWQFRRWGLFERHPRYYYLLLLAMVMAWLAQHVIWGHLGRVESGYRIFYSWAIVLMAVSTVNRLLMRHHEPLWKNAIFLICMGLIVYFTYKILVEAFWVYGLNLSAGFRMKVYDILAFVNLAANLTYAIAVLWMPRNKAFTLPY